MVTLRSGLVRVRRIGFRRDVRVGDAIPPWQVFYIRAFGQPQFIVERRSARFLYLREVRS